MNSFGRKIISAVFGVVVLSLLVNFFRQGVVYHRINKRLAREKEALKVLEEKNRQLKERLEEVKSPKFLEKEASMILGLAEDSRGLVTPTEVPEVQKSEGTPLPNYEKWWRLFVY